MSCKQFIFLIEWVISLFLVCMCNVDRCVQCACECVYAHVVLLLALLALQCIFTWHSNIPTMFAALFVSVICRVFAINWYAFYVWISTLVVHFRPRFGFLFGIARCVFWSSAPFENGHTFNENTKLMVSNRAFYFVLAYPKPMCWCTIARVKICFCGLRWEKRVRKSIGTFWLLTCQLR